MCRAVLLDESDGSEPELQRLWTGSKCGLRVANGPGVPRMGQGQMRAMLAGALALKKPLTETMELARTLFTRQEYAVTFEAARLTKRQAQWTVLPRFDPATDCRPVKLLDLVLAAERDVRGDEGCLNWIKCDPEALQACAPRLIDEERELSSAAGSGGHGSGGHCVASPLE